MPLTQADTLPDFFARHSLTAQDAAACFDFLYRWHTGCKMTPVRDQGGCSYTLVLRTSQGDQRIIQFRLQQHAISSDIACDAVRVFPGLAPRLTRSDFIHMSNGKEMQVVEMEQLEDICVADVLSGHRRLLADEVSRLQDLLCDLADFFAIAWKSAVDENEQRRRADGLVGSSILERLDMLARDLPTARLRIIASEARRAVTAGVLGVLPVVLNHGDLIPRNLLIDPGTWRLTGVVDWAESEYLPFGMALYGVEHLLGFLEGRDRLRFVYYSEADGLREAFWKRLRVQVRELSRPQIWRAMLLARTIGMLLWHGVAWDDGKRDRALGIEHDVEDLAYLEAFIATELCSVQAKL